MTRLNPSEIETTEQQLLMDAILSEQPLDTTQYGFNVQGVNIYRRNLLANAQRALMISFPTIFELLDSDISASLVQQFLQISPPDKGDWTQWGEHFPAFLGNTEVGDNFHYLSDCAWLDWQVHCALQGSDQVIGHASLALLSELEPEKIFIEFNQNVKVRSPLYPLTDIFTAHHHSDEATRETALKNAKKALSTKSFEQVVMVYRPEFQPQVTTLSTSEATFTLCLLTGSSLGESLDAVKNDSDFSFEQWLMSAIERNLIYKFKEK